MYKKILSIGVLISYFMMSTCGLAQGVHKWYSDQTWHAGIDKSISDFFGGHVGTYVGYAFTEAQYTPSQGAQIGNQFLAVFDGIPLESTPLANGTQLYSYAKPHDAAIKAAVITTAQGSTEMLAAALIHYSCGEIDKNLIFDKDALAKNYGKECSSIPTVTVFFKDSSHNDPAVRDELLSWARSNIGVTKFKFRVVVLDQ